MVNIFLMHPCASSAGSVLLVEVQPHWLSILISIDEDVFCIMNTAYSVCVCVCVCVCVYNVQKSVLFSYCVGPRDGIHIV
jgi:hypothetical protein